ncbi:MAG: hypothetical protein ACRECH_08420 [Nitrososphaerales archaeon]
MAHNSPTVPAAVESIVTHNQALHTCLNLKIINYHALAAIIKSEVEKMTGRPTTINTLVVAIKRYSDTLEEKKNHKLPPFDVLRDATITLTSDVADVTIRPKKSEFPNILRKIVEISSKLDESPDLFKSSNLIKLVAGEKEYKSSIRSELGKTNIANEVLGLSKLTLHLSPQAKRDSGFPLFITELLYRNGINVVHSYIDEDTIILVNKADAPRAFEILDEEITRSEQLVAIPRSKVRRKTS